MARGNKPFFSDMAKRDAQQPHKPTSLVFPIVWFFLLYSSSGTAPPYLALHYREKVGLSTMEIGYLFAVSPFVSFVAAAFWTAVADKCNRHRTIVVFLSLITAGSYIMMGNVNSFPFLMMLTVANSFFGGPIGAFVDIYTLDVLGPARAGYYGRLRMVGTIALGAMTFLTGLLVQYIAHGDYTIAFAIYGVLQAAFILTVAFSPWRKPVPFTSIKDLRRASQEVIAASIELVTTDRQRYEHSMWNLFASRYMGVFLLTSIIHGAARTMMGTYLFVFLSEYMHSAPMLLGLSSPFSIGLEAPGFFFSSFFLARIGFRKMLYLSFIAILVRAAGYTTLASYAAPRIHNEEEGWNYAPVILAVELTQGVAYSQFWSAGVHFINAVSPDSLKTSAQGIFNGLSGGFASGMGNIAGGILLDSKGPAFLFQMVILTTTAAAMLFSFIGTLPHKVEMSVQAEVTGKPYTPIIDDSGNRINGGDNSQNSHDQQSTHRNVQRSEALGDENV